MSKTIKERNGSYVKLNIFEKFIKMNHPERKDFLRFLGISLIALATLTVPLIIAFNGYTIKIIISSLFIIILLILIYLFFYKKPKNGFSAYFG